MSSRRHRDRTPKPCPGCGGKTRDGLLCRTCTDHTARRLHDLPDLWVDLQRQVTKQTRIRSTSSPIHARPAEPAQRRAADTRDVNLGQVNSRLPFDPAASTVAHRIQAGGLVTHAAGQELVIKGLRDWVTFTVRTLHAVPPRAGVTDMARHLEQHLPAIRRLDVAVEFAGDVWDWVDAITTVIDLPMRDSQVKVGPCVTQVDREYCPGTLWGVLPQERDSTRPDRTPATFARCDTCGAEWPSSAFARLPERMAARQAVEARRRALAREVARVAC